MMADTVTPAYQFQQQTNNAPAPQPQQQLPGASQAAIYYDNTVSNDDSNQPPIAVQQQYYQPQPFEKPNINIRPLLETGPPNSGQHTSTEFPSVGFSVNNNNTIPTSGYALNGQEEEEADTSLSSSTRRMNLKYQLFLDRISPYPKARWAFSLLALGVFLARVVLSQGWYVICYALGIYYLNLLIGFISPRVDPSLAPSDDEDEDNGPMLPTHANDEFKPFIRRVPEFKFWLSGTNSTLIALLMTLFDIFDVPVFWPILLIYFIILTACTMRQQIKHMIRYSYVPWDSGKKKYVGSGGSTSTNI